MGIQGLLPLLKSIHKPCNLKKFAGQTIGVDAYGWLHRGTIACAMELAMDKPTRKFVEFAMHRVRMLQHFGVTPFLVFDGDYLPSKAATEADRAKKREDSKKLGLELLNAGKTSQAYLELQKAIDVTPEMARLLIDELKKTGVQYLVAPYEADAQMVYLERRGLISAIISEDSDLLVFGAKCLLTKLDQYGNCIEVNRNDFCACQDINLTGWSDNEFRCMAILSGCDYLNSISNMGLKTAYRMVRKYKTIEKVIRMLQFDGKYYVPKGYLEAFYQAELTFLHQRVYCPISNKLVFHTKPTEPLDEQKMLFIGAYVEPEVARLVATGDVNPMTKKPIPPDQNHKTGAARTSFLASKQQPRRSVTSDDLKKGVSIQEFFKPKKRIPLGELDPNCFTPSPTQQNALLRNVSSWAAEPIPRQYLHRSNTDTQPQLPQSAPSRPIGRTLQSVSFLSETRPQKRSRLCADNVVLELSGETHKSNLERSPFFAPCEADPSPSVGRSSKAKRSKKDDITIFSDDSMEEALLLLPDFDTLPKPKPKNKSIITFDDEELKEENNAPASNMVNMTEEKSKDEKVTNGSQSTVPNLTQSSSVISSADESPIPSDSVGGPAFNSLREKFAFTPHPNPSDPFPIGELTTPPVSLRHSRIPRAVKAPTASILSTKSVPARILTPLQSLGAKALNRPSRLPPTPPFTPKSASIAAFTEFKGALPLKHTFSDGVPFPEVARPSTLNISVQVDPVHIPLPVPNKDELVALSIIGSDGVENQNPAVVLIESKGSEDLIVRDSEEELEDEISSPINSPTGTSRLGLGKFAFQGK